VKPLDYALLGLSGVIAAITLGAVAWEIIGFDPWERRWVSVWATSPNSFELICAYSEGFEIVQTSVMTEEKVLPLSECEDLELMSWVEKMINDCPVTTDNRFYSCPQENFLVNAIWEDQGQKNPLN
jgi:hypothetical protein